MKVTFFAAILFAITMTGCSSESTTVAKAKADAEKAMADARTAEAKALAKLKGSGEKEDHQEQTKKEDIGLPKEKVKPKADEVPKPDAKPAVGVKKEPQNTPAAPVLPHDKAFKNPKVTREVLGLFAEPLLIQATTSGTGNAAHIAALYGKMQKAADHAREVLKANGMVGLPDAARACAAKFSTESLILVCPGGPKLAQIQGKLGKEDGQEKGKVEGALSLGGEELPLTWYQFGWLHFGALEDGSIYSIRVDCKNVPAAKEEKKVSGSIIK